MTEVKVSSGICGFKTTIKCNSEDMQNVLVEIETECPNFKPMSGELKEVDGYEECFAKVGDSGVYETARRYCKHASCPVPCAIIKGIEAACGLALPKDVEISISKT